MANEQEQVNKPVNVLVTNINDPKTGIENVRKESEKIYKLLDGRNYKDTIINLNKSQNLTLRSTQNIEKLLGDIKTSISQGSLSSPYTPTNFSTVTQDSLNSNSSKEEKDWRNQVKTSLLAIENVVVGERNTEETLKTITEGIKELLKEGNLGDEIKDRLTKLSGIVGETKKQIKDKYTREEEKTKAEEESIKRAQGALDDIRDSNLVIIDSLKDVGRQFISIFKNSFKDVFNKWDHQTALLKESGMGGPNAALLNRMTRRTMDATEETLGWNVSIDKAIKATNAMLEAGQSPRYIRENNKQLIMGLEGVGLNLGQTTIKAIGQSVFNESQVKELTQGWAELTSKDTEGALNTNDVTSFLESDDFKKALTTMMMDGTISYAEVQQEIIKQAKEAVKIGAVGKDALNMALVSAQNNLGRGAVTVIPQNLQSFIGVAQTAGTFSGNVGNLTRDYAEAIRAAKSNTEINRKLSQISAVLAQNNDFSVLENIQFNDGHTRRLATQEDIEAGQYEGLIPRAGKFLAGLLPAESIGGVSQRLTGDATALTTASGSLIGGAVKTLGSVIGSGIQTKLLSQIETNTRTSGNILGEFTGKGGSLEGSKLGGIISKFSKWAGPIGLAVAGIGVTATGIVALMQQSAEEEKASKEAEQRALESYAKEMELEKQRREAILNGNTKLADEIGKQLIATREITNQELKNKVNLDEDSSDSKWKVGGTLAGALAGAIAGTAIGGPLGAIIGGLAGVLTGFGGTSAVVNNSNPNMEKELPSARESLAKQYEASKNKYASGGIITTEQIATLGEENKPEVVIPLTNPERAEELMSQAASMSTTNPEVASMLSQEPNMSTMGNAETSIAELEANKTSIADLIIQYARSLEGIPYVAGKNYMQHPERGVVCNQLVEYAYNKAGVPLKSRTVHYHLKSGEWGLTETPQPGFVIFSNYGYKDKYGLDDYGHLGIIGHGTERIHASSKTGRVTIDPDFTKTLAYETRSAWTKAGKKPYVFGFLKGLDYGTGVTPVEIENVVTEQQPILQNTAVSDVETPKEYATGIIESSYTPLPKTELQMSYAKVLNNLDSNNLEYTGLNSDVINDILRLHKNDYSQNFTDMLSVNNPLGLLETNGSMKEYKNAEAGIQDFISKIEESFDDLESMSYKDQLTLLKDNHYIKGSDYDRLMFIHQDKLTNALDNLNRSVQESNRIANKKTTMSMPNITPVSGRRYT